MPKEEFRDGAPAKVPRDGASPKGIHDGVSPKGSAMVFKDHRGFLVGDC